MLQWLHYMLPPDRVTPFVVQCKYELFLFRWFFFISLWCSCSLYVQIYSWAYFFTECGKLSDFHPFGTCSTRTLKQNKKINKHQSATSHIYGRACAATTNFYIIQVEWQTLRMLNYCSHLLTWVKRGTEDCINGMVLIPYIRNRQTIRFWKEFIKRMPRCKR